ncbi:hypothetical protein Nhal_1138 [Nitrosococcus halophilus Nc 4]|uniref:Uncharacterized protein n=1 Tax=Nitrosococcus halophilus (strain Nc4) TaxID=472759 RepID=D5BZL1_NITHN|nr:hypothetical protein [Nitrosococcus halophilus]ADE14306.1 hypothetical protein Nhal_1138 [Nitrosococcus halophilus Nc 4]
MGNIGVNENRVNYLITKFGLPLIIAAGMVMVGIVVWKLLRKSKTPSTGEADRVKKIQIGFYTNLIKECNLLRPQVLV